MTFPVSEVVVLEIFELTGLSMKPRSNFCVNCWETLERCLVGEAALFPCLYVRESPRACLDLLRSFALHVIQ